MSILQHFRATERNHSYRIVTFDNREDHESMTKHLAAPGLTCQIVDQHFLIQGDWNAFCGRSAEYYYDIGMFHGLARSGKTGPVISWHNRAHDNVESIRFEIDHDADHDFAIMWVSSLLNGLSGEHQL